MTLSISGIGIGFRRAHFETLFLSERSPDWLEVVSENYLDATGRPDLVLSRAQSRWPIVAHGVSLNIGADTPLDVAYLGSLGRLLDRVGAEVVSDHLCWSALGDWHSLDLLPLPWSEPFVEHCVRRIAQARAVLGRPLMLENITQYASMPGSTMSQGAFVSAVLELSDSGLLLDLNNLYVNAKNSGSSPDDLLRELPLARAWQVHLAGHRLEQPPQSVRETAERTQGVAEALWLDDHGAAVCDDVWALYETALQLCGPIPTLIEWDTRIPPIEILMDEVDRARAVCARVLGGSAP
ncbi:MAG: DUF692 domain-containing protein [Deltaproteobacteria bacterium]|nr:DUF692 domain-containing protein [Deltaproteobacteria bacterium]